MAVKSVKITLIGSGNVPWHIGPALENSGHVVTSVYSRSLAKAKRLSGILYNAVPTDSLDFSESQAELFIVSVTDDVLEEVADLMIVPDLSCVAHTSGSMPMSTLVRFGEEAGVFYPVQTFTQGRKIDLSRVPICIEAASDKTENLVYALANSISRDIYYLDSDKRKILHIAAVFANNFTNHIFSRAKCLMDEQNLNYEMLHALILETASKAVEMEPGEAQTGPAKRMDTGLMRQHLDFLTYNPDLKELYRILSEGIINTTSR